MKTIKCTIKGRTPLLMNNPASMVKEKSARKSTSYDDKDAEAEGTAYRMKDGTLYIPSRCLYAFLINSAKGFKIPKQNLASLLAGTVQITPFEVSLGTKKYEVDVQRCVIQRASVMKARAKLSDWEASFDINYDEKWLANGGSILKEVVESGGSRIGLLDFRPQKRGPYGTFEISSWKEMK